MKISSEELGDRLENYEDELKGFRSYVQELQTMTAKLGTDKEQFEIDLLEAQHNIKFYEGEIAEIKDARGKSAKGGGQHRGGAATADGPGKGITSVIFSSIGFIVGAIFGSRLKSRKDK
jgi:peptidoglycan hydrolase CwlO-like protein